MGNPAWRPKSQEEPRWSRKWKTWSRGLGGHREARPIGLVGAIASSGGAGQAEAFACVKSAGRGTAGCVRRWIRPVWLFSEKGSWLKEAGEVGRGNLREPHMSFKQFK